VTYRVVYVEVERQRREGAWARLAGAREPLRETRQRLAEEMERIGEEMQRRGLRLIGVTPIIHGEGLSVITTEAVWMHFVAEREPKGRCEELPNHWAETGSPRQP